MSGIEGYSDNLSSWQPAYAFEVRGSDGCVLFSVDQEGKPWLNEKIELSQLKEVGLAQLKVIREMIDTAVYDLDRVPKM